MVSHGLSFLPKVVPQLVNRGEGVALTVCKTLVLK